jgi:hypothetical protein
VMLANRLSNDFISSNEKDSIDDSDRMSLRRRTWRVETRWRPNDEAHPIKEAIASDRYVFGVATTFMSVQVLSAVYLNNNPCCCYAQARRKGKVWEQNFWSQTSILVLVLSQGVSSKHLYVKQKLFAIESTGSCSCASDLRPPCSTGDDSPHPGLMLKTKQAKKRRCFYIPDLPGPKR